MLSACTKLADGNVAKQCVKKKMTLTKYLKLGNYFTVTLNNSRVWTLRDRYYIPRPQKSTIILIKGHTCLPILFVTWIDSTIFMTRTVHCMDAHVQGAWLKANEFTLGLCTQSAAKLWCSIIPHGLLSDFKFEATSLLDSWWAEELFVPISTLVISGEQGPAEEFKPLEVKNCSPHVDSNTSEFQDKWVHFLNVFFTTTQFKSVLPPLNCWF